MADGPDELRDRILGRLEETKPLYYEDAADDLLPVVRKAVAAELDAAADDWQKPGRPHRPVPKWLRDRAARWRADQ